MARSLRSQSLCRFATNVFITCGDMQGSGAGGATQKPEGHKGNVFGGIHGCSNESFK